MAKSSAAIPTALKDSGSVALKQACGFRLEKTYDHTLKTARISKSDVDEVAWECEESSSRRHA